MKLNVLIYSTVSPFEKGSHGGAETSMRLLAESLAATGVNVIYSTTSSEKRLKTTGKQTVNGLTVITTYRSILPLSKKHTARKIVKNINYRIYEKGLRKILSENKINLVYTYYELEACLFFLKLKDEYDFKYVVRVAGMHWAKKIIKKPSRKSSYENIFSQADALNFISNGLVEIFNENIDKLSMKISPKMSFVLDIGVNSSRLSNQFNVKNENKKDCFKLLMASRLSHLAKRQDLLIEAASLLPASFNFELVLVGDGTQRDHLLKQIESLQLQDKVKMIPFLSQEQLWELMSNMDLLCHACDYEGLSKIIIESMGMGLPVLASNVLPLNMYIKDGENSFLVDNEPDKWAQKIIELEKETTLLKNIGENATAFIQSNYNAETNVIKFIEIFENL